MHQVLHIGILASTLLGAAGLILLVLWPLVSDAPLPDVTKRALAALVIVAAALLLTEWRYVH